MERYICIHGHFYQPPRENPWLEAVELQDNAYPYHDWNERIAAECYEQNTVARILDDQGNIVQIINNFTWISFSIGPMLMAWLEHHRPDVYQFILSADRESRPRFGGHGAAIAQVYNHVIMPLANRRDKETQVLWGIRDFVYRFGRQPEGMWLSETAVDLETLDILAEQGIRFTLLAPHQAGRIRPLEGDAAWEDVSGGRIDPTRPYLQRLPSGRTIALFFYDDPIAHDIAFEDLVSNGETFANRLLEGFSAEREHAQLVHVATDGETYGHYHRGGEKGLAYALYYLETNNLAHITNYGEFLELSPPAYEVEIIERTSRSCPHGVECWYHDCGCKSSRHRRWNQDWREPLRDAFDWLRDTMAPRFQEHGSDLFYDPWATRNDYIHVILDRSTENLEAFWSRHTTHPLNEEEQTRLLRLLELQRQLLLMYSSCGWFFDDVSSTETIQVLYYAGRALHLSRMLFDDAEVIEQTFLQMLEPARSNLLEHRDARAIYERWVRPAEVDLMRVGAHFAVSLLFEKFATENHIFCYQVDHEDYHRFEPGMAKVVFGRVRVTSTITRDSRVLGFGVMHFGDHNVNAGVRAIQPDEDYMALLESVTGATDRGDIAEVMRLLDSYLQGLTYSVPSLFRDAQRRFLDMMLETTLSNDEALYRQIYERRSPLMHLLTSLNTPLPRALHAAAEFVLNSDLRRAIGETMPDQEYIQSILERVHMWNIELDTVAFTYTFQQTIEQLVAQVREQPDDLGLLQTMDRLLDVASSMPFEVDFWKIQNIYYKIASTIYVEMQERADDSDDDARAWAEQFIALGNKLGVRVTQMQDFSSTVTVASVTNDVLSQTRIPRATYRFQFSPSFTFDHAIELVPYLDQLGISDCYASPLFKPRAGSSHGYDVCDHSQINPVLGGEAGLDALTAALRERDMSILLDIVPNHMGIYDASNRWWMDVLENGPASEYAAYFDIEWNPVKLELANKVLLPILGDQYGRILENGELGLVYEEGTFSLRYYEHQFPVAPDTYHIILGQQLETLQEQLEPEDEQLQDFQSILTAISYLPPRTDLQEEKLAERNREKEIIKRRIDTLYQESDAVREAIDAAVQAFNGNVGDPRSFDLLDNLINEQSYRLAFWRVAAEEINYRRFFDINDLAAIRTEDPQVFKDIHELVFRLTTEGKIAGVRIDHIDGLFDPDTYFRQLQEGYVLHKVQERLTQVRTKMSEDETLARRVSARVEDWMTAQREQNAMGKPSWPLYVVAEKILGEDESLPQSWAVHGTTGYDFLATTNNLFVNTAHGWRFDSLYQHFTGMATPFYQLVNANKKMIMLVSLDSEIYALSHQLERIAERNRRYRDFTLNTLTFAIREVVASLSVYRTYTTELQVVLPRDQQFIEESVADAKRRNPRTFESVFDFIRETLLLSKLSDFQPEDRDNLIHWVMKFQQITGPVMAKGVEDTTFYVYNRLVSLNEVGGHPDNFGSTVTVFHERNSENQRFWPHTLLSTSTHDTKRSEDVRARINVLSEMPDTWQAALERWSDINRTQKTIEHDRDGKPQTVPTPNDEYLLYQSLLGAWPLAQHPPGEHAPGRLPLMAPQDNSDQWQTFRERISNYMQKATKEAKVNTSWVQPNQAYDSAMQGFIQRILDSDGSPSFLDDMRAFGEQIAYYGQFNSLSQTLLKLTVPGVPDVYQGNELWDFSLVDPDNRRPVDYALRRRMLDELQQQIAEAGDNLVPLAHHLLDSSADGRIKLYLTYRLLAFRRAHATLFAQGNYVPLDAVGVRAEHVCAFSRSYEDQTMVVVVPRLVAQLAGETSRPPIGAAVWDNTQLVLPGRQAGYAYRNVLTGEVLTVSTNGASDTDADTETEGSHVGLALSSVFASFPVALLLLEQERTPPEPAEASAE